MSLRAELAGVHNPPDVQRQQHHVVTQASGSAPAKTLFPNQHAQSLEPLSFEHTQQPQEDLQLELQQLQQSQQELRQSQPQQQQQQPLLNTEDSRQVQLLQLTPQQSLPPFLQTHQSLPDSYPPAECSQEEVLYVPDLFEATLKRVHEHMGITERVPRVGGKDLDLHMLYKNVCGLGGCENVIMRKLWRGAAETFKFPETITNVSFVLRKAYITFLWDYEQIYMHNKAGQQTASPPASQKEASTPTSADLLLTNASPVARQPKKRKIGDNVATSFVGLIAGSPTQLVAAARNPGQPEAATVGSRGTVVVDSRFDAGYFVTVRLGKQEFRGILYYPPPQYTQQLGPAASVVTKDGKDKHAPKPNKTPFNFFSVDARVKAKDSFPEMSQTDITKKVGEMWQKATNEEKAPYIALSNQDKNRYQAELEAYNHRLAADAAAQQAGQAMSAVAAAQHAMAAQPLIAGVNAFGAPAGS